MTKVEHEVAAFVDARQLLVNCRRLGVGFSGGPDSAALLLLMHTLYPRLDIIACHVDHGQEHSASTAKRASEIAESAGVPFERVSARVVVADKGWEASARQARFEAFRSFVAEANIDVLALGHTADDRAETLLFNLIRGAGLDGLSTMRPSRQLRRGTQLVRPLLGLSRRQTLDYCQRNGIAPVDDPMNKDMTLSRNQIRSMVLPVLESVRQGATERIARTAQLLDEDRQCLDEFARQALEDSSGLVESGTEWVAFDYSVLTTLPKSIAARIVRLTLGPLLDDQMPNAQALATVLAGHGGSLAGTRLTSRREGGHVVVLSAKHESMLSERSEADHIELTPGSTTSFGYNFVVSESEQGHRFAVRPLRRGDRFSGRSRTLLAMLARRDVALRYRQQALVVLRDGEPVVVCGDGFDSVTNGDDSLQMSIDPLLN